MRLTDHHARMVSRDFPSIMSRVSGLFDSQYPGDWDDAHKLSWRVARTYIKSRARKMARALR